MGNANELNAGYAADGYARVKGLGALVTETKFPFASLMWGKAVLNEIKPNFAGIYVGSLSQRFEHR